MEIIDTLHAELEDLQKKYWRCFNNWDCDEDLEKLQMRMEEIKYKLTIETSPVPRLTASFKILPPVLLKNG